MLEDEINSIFGVDARIRRLGDVLRDQEGRLSLSLDDMVSLVTADRGEKIVRVILKASKILLYNRGHTTPRGELLGLDLLTNLTDINYQSVDLAVLSGYSCHALQRRLRRIAFLRFSLPSVSFLLSSPEATDVRPDFYPHLTELTISHCNITDLDDSLRFLPALRTLVVTYCKLTKIPQALSLCPTVETLDLGFNRITSLDAPEGMLESLTTLVLRYNNISSLSNLPCFSSLVSVDLSSNTIAAVDEISYLTTIHTLRFLYLAGNPICYSPSYRHDVLELFASSPYFLLEGSVPQLDGVGHTGAELKMMDGKRGLLSRHRVSSDYSVRRAFSVTSEDEDDLERDVKLRRRGSSESTIYFDAMGAADDGDGDGGGAGEAADDGDDGYLVENLVEDNTKAKTTYPPVDVAPPSRFTYIPDYFAVEDKFSSTGPSGAGSTVTSTATSPLARQSSFDGSSTSINSTGRSSRNGIAPVSSTRSSSDLRSVRFLLNNHSSYTSSSESVLSDAVRGSSGSTSSMDGGGSNSELSGSQLLMNKVSSLSVNQHLGLYFRTCVFTSAKEFYVAHWSVYFMYWNDPTGNTRATRHIAVLTNRCLFILLDDESDHGKFSDRPVFPLILTVPLSKIVEIVVGLFQQYMRVMYADGETYGTMVLLARDSAVIKDASTTIHSRSCSIIGNKPPTFVNESETDPCGETRSLLQKDLFPSSLDFEIKMYICGWQVKDKVRRPITVLLTSLKLYLLNEDFTRSKRKKTFEESEHFTLPVSCRGIDIASLSSLSPSSSYPSSPTSSPSSLRSSALGPSSSFLLSVLSTNYSQSKFAISISSTNKLIGRSAIIIFDDKENAEKLYQMLSEGGRRS